MTFPLRSRHWSMCLLAAASSVGWSTEVQIGHRRTTGPAGLALAAPFGRGGAGCGGLSGGFRGPGGACAGEAVRSMGSSQPSSPPARAAFCGGGAKNLDAVRLLALCLGASAGRPGAAAAAAAAAAAPPADGLKKSCIVFGGRSAFCRALWSTGVGGSSAYAMPSCATGVAALTTAATCFAASSRCCLSSASTACTCGMRWCGYRMPMMRSPSSSSTRTARIPRSLLLRVCSCLLSTRSSWPHTGTTLPESTAHDASLRPTAHRDPTAHPGPCEQCFSVSSYTARHPASASSGFTCLYTPLRSLASISKKLGPVLGRHTAYAPLAPGLLTARRNTLWPNMSRLLM
mmetsp:Transcript_14796/g.50856  ORF Transcript_14796/g.50856 Transcript_14796/m.50856 type:complete len:345 (+) Transcript_14796:437-1471(+)